MDRHIKYFFASLIINIALIYVFYEFVVIPVNQISKAIAASICNQPGINCGPKK